MSETLVRNVDRQNQAITRRSAEDAKGGKRTGKWKREERISKDCGGWHATDLSLERAEGVRNHLKNMMFTFIGKGEGRRNNLFGVLERV